MKIISTILALVFVGVTVPATQASARVPYPVPGSGAHRVACHHHCRHRTPPPPLRGDPVPPRCNPDSPVIRCYL